jgi:DNA segregation ATPase FtsK/SpoIIIE-like protein
MKLLKIFIAAAWALGLTLASAAYADPPAVVGRLNYVSGPVSFAPAEAADEWVAAPLNRPITTGDRLWTDTNAFAEMHVGSLAVRMAPQTSLDVLNLDDRALQLRVAQGDVNLRVRRIPSGRLIEIATPNGSVVVRQPGSYRISVDADSSIVTVRAGGQAEVFGTGGSVLLRDAEEVVLSRSRPELFAAAQPDEFDRWAADRDRRHDRVASTRYVPVEMTGYEDLDQYGEWRTVAEYGNLWIPSAVPTGWAPYRYGHWVWISPWGWSWIDDQPWGFAPSHYGRWVWYHNYWAWAPGRIIERPVYSPALVAFIGGSNFSVSIGAGPAVGWVPLGYREPYMPWYTASRTYVQNVNVAYVTNVTNINTTNIRYVNRTAPQAVTVVSRDAFIAARPVQQATISVPSRTLASAPVTRGAPVSQPQRTSFVRQERGSRPPAQVIAREAVVVNRPPTLARESGRASAPRVAESPERPPVRVIERGARVSLPINQAPRAEARAARPAIQAPRADAPAAQQRQPQAVQQQAPGAPQSRQQEQAREQQGERLREQKRAQEEQQKAQAQQQADQLDRERKQRTGQQEQAREQQRSQQEGERGQKAAQRQREREQQQRTQQEQQQRQAAEQAAQQEQQRAQQEQQRAQQEQQRAAQKAQQDQQRAQQEQQRQQQAAQQAQKAQPQRPAEPQAAPQESEKGKRDRARKDQSEKDKNKD